MPQITKQTRTTSGPTRTSSSSVLSEAVPVDQLQDDFVKIVIYGQNRTGKTTLACQFPKPLLLVAFEPTKTGGAKSVTKIPGVTFLRVESSEKAIRLAKELPSKFKTIVLDSVTSYQDIILKEILNLPDAPSMLGWGTVTQDQYRERSEKTREALRPFLKLDCHVVALAKEKDHNPPKDDRNRLTRGSQLESFFAADLGGATVSWLQDACDAITRLYLDKEVITKSYKAAGKEVEREEETGKLVRRLRLKYHTNFAAGLRSPNPELVPEYIEAESPEEMYSELMRILNGEEA